ncbi:unnamed protein product [Arctogadus glacialis]
MTTSPLPRRSLQTHPGRINTSSRMTPRRKGDVSRKMRRKRMVKRMRKRRQKRMKRRKKRRAYSTMKDFNTSTKELKLKSSKSSEAVIGSATLTHGQRHSEIHKLTRNIPADWSRTTSGYDSTTLVSVFTTLGLDFKDHSTSQNPDVDHKAAGITSIQRFHRS